MYDAFLLLSFGGPEGPDDVMPFLENVLRGKNVPRERMLAVAEHYQHFGGVSPINGQNRELLAAIEKEFRAHGITLPVYWGNRNWHPMLPDTLTHMKRDGVQRALGFFTSAFSSYSGCRQYRENIAVAQEAVGEGAPAVDKLRMFFNHPGFIEPMIERTKAAFAQIPAERHEKTVLLFSAHSIPMSMATNCKYETQLREAARLIAAGVNHPQHRLVYQSRSGPPTQPWLEPDVGDVLKELAAAGDVKDVVLVPVGFISDHMEVLFDLDHEAHDLAGELGIHFVRAGTVGTHPRFVRMIRELVEERMNGSEKQALGDLGPNHDVCPVDCCKYEPRRPV
jgi:ferrochelatase